ncbi:MAG: carbohydrate kinase family protein [Desulfobacterales bacterium]|jgi:sulfofructose kinase
MKTVDVLVIGRSCVDHIALIDQFPSENQKVPLKFRLIEGGGQGGTASCCISNLGGHVAYVGKLGDDEEGRFCLKRLKDFGVTTEYIEIVNNGKTPVAYAFVNTATAERTIFYEPNELPRIKLDQSMQNLFTKSGVILLDPEVTYLGHKIKRLAPSNAKIVYDGERWRDGIQDIMDTADYFIPCSDFLDAGELNFGDIPLVQKISQLNKRIYGRLIVTCGQDGAYYVLEDTLYHVPAFEIKAVDTIGAGDNFHAAFALALAKGFDLQQCVKFSVSVASLSCRKYGGRNGIPDINEALEFANRLVAKAIATV